MKKVFSFVAIAAMTLAVTSCGEAEEAEADVTAGEEMEAEQDEAEMEGEDDAIEMDAEVEGEEMDAEEAEMETEGEDMEAEEAEVEEKEAM